MNTEDFKHKALKITFDLDEVKTIVRYEIIIAKHDDFRGYLTTESRWSKLYDLETFFFIPSDINQIEGAEKIFISIEGEKEDFDPIEISYEVLSSYVVDGLINIIKEIIDDDDVFFQDSYGLKLRENKSIKIGEILEEGDIELIKLNTNTDLKNIEIEKWL